MTAKFATYVLSTPGGDTPHDMAQALRRMIEQHSARFGYSPKVTVALAPSNAAKALALPGVDVIAKGGIMVWEAWLLIEEKKPSRLKRIAQAQRPITPDRAREILQGQQLALGI